MEQLLILLYPVVAVIQATAYFPQIRALVVSKTASRNMSIQSWLLWTFSNLIGWGYVSVVVDDFMLSLVSLFNLVMCATIATLIIHNRYVRYGECKNIFEGFVYYLFVDCFAVFAKQPAPVPVKERIKKR